MKAPCDLGSFPSGASALRPADPPRHHLITVDMPSGRGYYTDHEMCLVQKKPIPQARQTLALFNALPAPTDASRRETAWENSAELRRAVRSHGRPREISLSALSAVHELVSRRGAVYGNHASARPIGSISSRVPGVQYQTWSNAERRPVANESQSQVVS